MVLPLLTTEQKKKLHSLNVQAVYLFGSRAMNVEHPLSDYDYAVLVKEAGHYRGDFLYQELYEIFSDISPRSLSNDVIDIVFLRDAGLELCFHVVRCGVVIDDNDPKARLDFEERVTLLYCDYRPLLDEFDKTIMEAL